MKRFLIVSPLLLLLAYIAWSFRGPDSTSGAPAGHTGSPGDGKSCTFCHGGTATSIPGMITSDIPVTGYVPGDTYNISASASHATRVKFGFSVSPQNSFGVQLGTLRDTSLKTQLNGSNKYITHVGSGTSFPSGNATWNFQWIAPAAGSGAVTFYGAFNLSNNLNSSGGDIIQTSSLLVSENTTVNLSEQLSVSNTRIYPNPVGEVLSLDLPDAIHGEIHYQVMDVTGRQVIPSGILSGGDYAEITEVAVLSAGMYHLRLEASGQVASLPFIKR